MNIAGCSIFVGAVTAISLAALSTAPGQEKKAQESPAAVVGLSVARNDPQSEYGQSLASGIPAGTQLFVRVVLPDQYILELAEESNESVTLRTNEGNKLPLRSSGGLAFFSQVSEDHHSVVVPVASEELPGEKTTSLVVEGSLVVVCGSQSTTVDREVKLEAEQLLDLGLLKAKLTQVSEGFEPGTTQLELESDHSFDAIQSIHAIDAQGADVKVNSVGSSSFGFGDSQTYGRTLQVEAEAAAVKKLKITYFQRVERVEVPLKLEAGLALKE